MHYRNLTGWIFVFLLLALALMFLYPTPGMLLFGTLITAGLILVQVFIVLNAGEQSQKTLDDQWYDHP